MADLIHTDATGLAELIRTRKFSSVEVVQAHLDRIKATNPDINAIVTLADGDNLVGVVSVGDVIKVMFDRVNSENQHLMTYIHGSY